MYRSEPVLDTNTLERLTRLGGESFLSDMVTIFSTQAPVRVEGAVAALATSDLDGVRRHAHSLVSMAGNLGARRLQTLASMIEQAAAASDITVLGELVPQMHPTFTAARAALAPTRSEVVA